MPTKEQNPSTPTSPTRISAVPAASTSTTAVAPEPTLQRLAVRTRGLPSLFSAYRLTARTTLTLSKQDRRLVGERGDWVITQGSDTLEVLPDDIFRHQYEPADSGALTVSGANRAEIERVLGIGSTLDGARLVGSIVRLARLSIGGVEIGFTPGQWEELNHRASKRGISVQALVEQIVAKITAEIWSV